VVNSTRIGTEQAIMKIPEVLAVVQTSDMGERMHALIRDLYPFCRSITGDGVRKTLSVVRERIGVEICEVPTGTPVFDWTVPMEWNVRDAYIENSSGEKVVDFHHSNLHLVSYSVQVDRWIGLDELKEHLFSLPQFPDWIPYRTSYYSKNWGFCLSHRQLQGLPQGEYRVVIDSSLKPGSLTYGELRLKGELPEEILISCHICHPSLCNDNLSGISLATVIAEIVARMPRRYSYVFLFVPSTIGSITWLARNESQVHKIKHGIVVANVGDAGPCTYKRSRRGTAEVDRAVEYVLKQSGDDFSVADFAPYGYDERQYCSPGFDLPVGCFRRTPHGAYPEYHTSADNLDFVKPEFLGDSLIKALTVLSVLERNRVYVSLNPKCEPQLGRRGLYRGYPSGGEDDLAVLWVLNLSDGNHSLLDIAERSSISFGRLDDAATALLSASLIEEAQGC
jgi:aminopeptidase-like protein